MAYVFTGYKRSLSVEVTKTINGVPQTGYPKTYPTATDIANGYFTYNSVQYPIPPNGMAEQDFAQLEPVQYNNLLNVFKLYVMSQEPNINFNTQAINSPEVYDIDSCPVGTPVEQTTEEQTTAETTEEQTTQFSPIILYCENLSADFAPRLPNGGDWELGIDLLQPAPANYTFDFYFEAHRTDEQGTFSDTVQITILQGHYSGSKVYSDGIQNQLGENWVVDFYNITNVTPDDGNIIVTLFGGCGEQQTTQEE